MKLYKLTDENSRTYGGCQWGEEVEHTASGEGELCSKGWLHAYEHPLLAVLLNPVHADFKNPQLWEAEGEIGKTDNGLKVGCTRLKTLRQIPLPEVSTRQRVRFAILCAKEVYAATEWVKWADDWLSNKNCDTKAWAAGAAAWATEAAAGAAAWATEAARAAEVAEAAEAAEHLGVAAWPAWAARAVVWATRAARAAAGAARAAGRAAEAAVEVKPISLIPIAITAVD